METYQPDLPYSYEHINALKVLETTTTATRGTQLILLTLHVRR
jgi:hypothetical protein